MAHIDQQIENVKNKISSLQGEIKSFAAELRNVTNTRGERARSEAFSQLSMRKFGLLREITEQNTIITNLEKLKLTDPEPITEIIIQEEPILDVPIEERFIPITPTNGQDNTLRNALIVGGALLLIL